MIIAKEERYGLDKKIYRIQQYIDIKHPSICIYGQLDENEKEKGRILEWDEVEVLFNDKETVIGFRTLTKDIKDFKGNASVDVICTTHNVNREKIEQQVYMSLANSGFINEVNGPKLGVSNVYSGLFIDDVKYNDVRPYHVFSFTIDIDFEYDICI